MNDRARSVMNHQVAGSGDGSGTASGAEGGGGTRYLGAAAVSSAPHDDQHVADDGHPCEQPDTQS